MVCSSPSEAELAVSAYSYPGLAHRSNSEVAVNSCGWQRPVRGNLVGQVETFLSDMRQVVAGTKAHTATSPILTPLFPACIVRKWCGNLPVPKYSW